MVTQGLFFSRGTIDKIYRMVPSDWGAFSKFTEWCLGTAVPFHWQTKWSPGDCSKMVTISGSDTNGVLPNRTISGSDTNGVPLNRTISGPDENGPGSHPSIPPRRMTSTCGLLHQIALRVASRLVYELV